MAPTDDAAHAAIGPGRGGIADVLPPADDPTPLADAAARRLAATCVELSALLPHALALSSHINVSKTWYVLLLRPYPRIY